VANRALQSFPLELVTADDAAGDDDKVDPLSPRVLVSDPDRFYAALEQRLGVAQLGPDEEPSPISPATRLVDGCRDLDR